MNWKFIYILITVCASLLGAQKFDFADSDNDQITESALDSFKTSEYSITEYTHEQSATRPTNVQVPSITRTTTANRCNSSNSQTNSAYKSDQYSLNYISTSDYSDNQSLNSGHTDSGTYFNCLCKRLI